MITQTEKIGKIAFLGNSLYDNLEAGKYVIGDPCYSICADNLWGQFCSILFPDRGCIEYGYFKYQDDEDEFIFFYGSTKYGDGEYPFVGCGGISGSLGVDAGCLAIIPLKMAQKLGDKQTFEITETINIDKPFNVEYSNGDFHFAGFTITTSEESDEDWED